MITIPRLVTMLTEITTPALVDRVRGAVIGDGIDLPGPWGPRRLVYADHTASGRALTFVEDYLRARVLPFYANTHSDSSGTGRRTNRLREQARETIRTAVGGGDDHVVIFTGSGATAAVDKLRRILELDRERPGGRPVVFVGPYEHHSNELPWRESSADVVRIRTDAAGRVDTVHLGQELARYADRPLRIGSFSAGSNVTGALTDVAAITALLHTHGALACWDYAAAGPHVRIDLSADGVDAAFLSPHKFPGGPGTPGVLVARKSLLRNAVPVVPGGGTISYVYPGAHYYHDDPAHREEGGTPAIVESIRAGLAFQLKERVGVEHIVAREAQLVRRAIESWRTNPAIEILGDPEADRLPIVSFVVHTSTGKRLHYNLVTALLNDVFGIQARGGCSCAGPYGHELLGIDDRTARRLAHLAVAGWLGTNPGWTRLSFCYYMSEEVFEYVVAAVHLVAAYGHRLLPAYGFDVRSGLWTHHDQPADPPGPDEAFDDRWPEPVRRPDEALVTQLAQARELFAAPPEGAPLRPALPAEVADLQWFAL